MLQHKYQVLYDEQCEICQAGASWLRILDHAGIVECIHYLSSPLLNSDSSFSADACARELHILRSDGRQFVGAAAVRELARQFVSTRWLGVILEWQPLRSLSDWLYSLVARNRYQLSKCRGGACRTTLSVPARKVPLAAFWSCYTTGFLIRLPLIAHTTVQRLFFNASTYARTWRRSYSLMDGRLKVFFLGGLASDTVPLIFGEHFWMILYDGLLIDPGGTRMAMSVERHLARLPAGAIRAIVATHAHEEHIGNLALAARITSAPVYSSKSCGQRIRDPHRIPRMRQIVIGQPASFSANLQELGESLATLTGKMDVISSPGHSDEHVVLYDRKSGVLIAGDAFMGTYFSSPNADVDSGRWLDTLTRLQGLEIRVLVTGHGQIFTLDSGIPEISGVVFRIDPMRCISERRAFLEWLREQVLSGIYDDLPTRAIEATLFPWNRSWSWENFFSDEMARLLSGGEFSRTQLVRTFVRSPGDYDPLVYQASCWGTTPTNHRASADARLEKTKSARR